LLQKFAGSHGVVVKFYRYAGLFFGADAAKKLI
jgi:hypothetical protein